ncbi:signal peptide peptidase SppA [Luteimonas sp. MC1572]|uniref:signal peptide peptidase SppA n=1 Tax=Luteimonas sp. MC1572 TaxID=2799325 RepID=UPI0018F073BF|nr:signal peptide peptidase SppA [Luteimonas sp. MC1572]MBJ6981714.1 signal peptide peptidase SppA [Luteimonas sp. MC1572]QQO03002.1 signal peptide peptidase SppA [Luteimonas sp. MC1572]
MSATHAVTPRRRGPITRVAVGAWNALNFTRRLVFNLLFLLLVIVVLVALASAERAHPLLDRTTLVIAPEGALVEQFSVDPVTRSFSKLTGQDTAEVRLRDLLLTLESAKDDKRIERVLLRTDRMAFSGYASLREVAAAVTELRAAGKQVVAYGEFFDQAQYLLAAQADEVYMDPQGGMVLEGLGRYRQYYREGLQDKLGVDIHLFKVGEFKSAAEPYVRDDASPESKQADLFWMNDIWQRFLGDVARARKLDAATLAAGIDTMPAGIEAAGGDLARYAVEQKLVDGLKTVEELQLLLAERGVADEDSDSGVREISMDAYLQHVTSPLADADARPQVAVVVAEGQIMGGQQKPGTVGGESTSALLRAARDDEKVKAVVLRVDSPGGEVFASEQIRREVVALKAAGKPVVVSMGDLAASGGYWISMDADRIYADESTITGSIGIFGMFPSIPRTLEKIGVHTDGVGTTRFAGAFDPTRPLQPEVGQVIQSVIDKGYREFTGKVASARNQTVEAVDAVARGRVWSGAQAKERGLVDEFGGLRTAVADAAERAGLGDAGKWRLRYVEKPMSPFETFISGFAGSRAGQALLGRSDFVQGLLAKALPQAEQELRFIEQTLSKGGNPVKAVVHCFCMP